MLSRKNRIKTSVLPVVFKKNLSFVSGHFVLKVNFNQEKTISKPKLAVIAPAKIVKKAVDRHLIKRRIKHIFQKKLTLIKDNLNLIVQVRENPLQVKFLDLEAELTDLFRKANVLNK